MNNKPFSRQRFTAPFLLTLATTFSFSTPAVADEAAEYRAAYECAMEGFQDGYGAGPIAYCVGNSRDPSAIEMKGYADAERDFAGQTASEPNVQIRVTNPVNQLFHIPFVRVELRAMDDQVMVKDVIVNRGNCNIENKDLFTGQPILPKQMKFGEKVTVAFSGPCEAAQVNVITNNGEWVWTMNF